MEPKEIAMNRPMYMSAINAPGIGAKFAAAAHTNSVAPAVTLLRWYCLVRYMIMLVLSPNPATFSNISFAVGTKGKEKIHQI